MNDTQPNVLLDAVDALTKPIRRGRIMETDHDHDWLSITEVHSKSEIRRIKKANKALAEDGLELLPVPEETRFTGEWWCPWCDQIAVTLDRTIPGTTLVRREDDPLLDQLETAIGNSLEASGGSQRPSERTPVDIAALQISIDIRSTIEEWMKGLGASPRGSLSLIHLLRSWYTLQLAAPGVDRTKTLHYWANRIRGILEPKDHPEIVGICPKCEFAFVLTDDARKRALQGTNGVSYDETKVDCLVCGADWTGWRELNALANATRRLDGQPERESPPLIA